MKKVFIVVVVLSALILSLVFRLWLAVNAKHGDMYNNISWGRVAYSHGLNGFYDLDREYWSHSKPNQPPGSILIHSFSIHIYESGLKFINLMNKRVPWFPSQLVWFWESSGELISIKFPGILADYLVVASLLGLGAVFGRRTLGMFAGLLYLANPAIWYITSFWGQTDAIVAAFSIGGLTLMFQKRFFWAFVFFALSFSTKASWLPMLPIILTHVYMHYPKALRYIFILPVVFFLTSFPFHPGLGYPNWIFNLVSGRILPGESSFITVNAFNLWHLLYGLNPHSSYSMLFGIQLDVLAKVMLLVALISSIFWVVVRRSPSSLIKSSALLFFGVFLFGSRMHERYFFPVIVLLTASIAVTKASKSFWFLYSLVSVCFLINVYHLWWAPGISWMIAIYSESFTKIISVLYIVAYLWLYRLELPDGQKVR